MGLIFDTHSHYTDTAFDADRQALLSALPEKGVALAMLSCVDLADAMAIQQLSEQYDYLYASVGIHPENIAEGIPHDAEQQIRSLAKHSKVRAIGEIGLDYHYEGYDRDAQMQLFEMQLQVARDLDLPVIVHCRDAVEDCMALLRKYRPEGVMHCFGGSVETAKEVLALGMYLGFTGVVTFKNAKKSLRVLEVVPEDRLVLETDCPYMAPEPFRGQRSTSDMIVKMAEKVALIKGVETEAILRQTLENGCRLYRIPMPAES